MIDLGLRMLVGASVGLTAILLLRRPVRRCFGAGPAFTLWLAPLALMLAPLLPSDITPVATWTLPAVLVSVHRPAAETAAQAAPWGWTAWLTLLWLTGTAVGLLRLAVHYVQLRRRAEPAPARWAPMLHGAAPGLDPRRVRVHRAGPALLWAWPRSLVLLPADFTARFEDAASRQLVLRHELTHARRGDALWTLLMEIASALLWFHPLAWLARPRFRLDQELACDAAALRALPQHRARYARALLDSAAVPPIPALIPWLAEPQLKERIAMIARIAPGALQRRAGFLAVAALLTSGVAFAGGTGAMHAAAPASSATPPSVNVSYKNRNPPRYPIKALHKGEQGNVVLEVTVDKAGDVTAVGVDSKGTTAPEILQSAAVAAAAKWKFNPGMKDGHPAGGKVTIPVRFSLSRSPSASHPCPEGYRYKKEQGKSFSCIAEPAASQS